MKIGVFSDVHGNLEALDACLARFKQEGVQGYIYCGDFIGYGPDPEACIEKILKLPLLACVIGNHDAVFTHPDLEEFFNQEARKSLDQSKQFLSDKAIRSLLALPAVEHKSGYTVLHGTPRDPIKEYFTSCAQFRSMYSLWKGSCCFVGHLHIPFYVKGTETNCSLYVISGSDATVYLDAKMRYVINPGAVGKPRDCNPQASFGIWDTQARSFRFLRQEYDFKKTQQKMMKAKMPSFLIDTLALGL
jgi:predicted phosphodiesterase